MERHWRILGAITLSLIGAWVCIQIRGLLGPLVLSLLIAYFFKPLVARAQKIHIPRWAASLLIMVGVVLSFNALIFFLIPFAESQIRTLIQLLPLYGDRLLHCFDPLWALLQPHEQATLKNLLTGSIRDIAGGVGRWLLGLLTNSSVFTSLLLYLFLTPLLAFHALNSWPQIVRTTEKLIPKPWRAQFGQFCTDLDGALGGYLRGQALVCLALIVYYSAALSLISLPYGVLIGTITGLFAFAPYIGVLIGLLLATSTALVSPHADISLLSVMVVYIGGHGFEGGLLTPFLIGQRIGLHPAWVLVTVLISGTVFGFLGLLLAMPIAAFVRICCRWLVMFYRATPLFQGSPTS